MSLAEKIKYFIRLHIFNVKLSSLNGEVCWLHILGILFDRRKWYYSISEYNKANRKWDEICYYLEHECTVQINERMEIVGDDFLPLPWHWRFSHSIKNWPLRKPLGLIFIGWLIRAIIGA